MRILVYGLWCALVCTPLFGECQNTSELLANGKILVEPLPQTSRAEGCAPSTAVRDLQWNNVRALIETGGSLWLDRSTGRGRYEVPRGGGVSMIYAGALWMGGISPDQQLKLAAITYRASGNDYWPGPLTNDGSAEIQGPECLEWDRFFTSEKADAQRHREYFDCLNDPTCDVETEFPDGYAIPGYFYEYPAHGNTAQGQDYYLAPFLDYDGDGFYNPAVGDYPWYDFLQEIDCEQRRRTDPVPLFGDQTFYWIFNDKGNIHTESQGEPIGMEIRAQAFAFATNDEVNNMTFYNFVLINQGTQTLTETYFGTYIDSDVGGHTDDYVGCDVQRGLGYAYNGDAFDNPTGLSQGYGAFPPAVGVDFFEGPYQDEDNVDNPLAENFIEATDAKGIPYRGIGIGYGDGIIDNERFGMRKFVYYWSSPGPTGGPTVASDYYNFLKGYWKNGQRMAYGGDGYNPNVGANLDIPADYMFPGDTDPLKWGTAGIATEPWTEVSSGNPPNDRRFMQSSGPFTLEPGDWNNITIGVLYARSYEGDSFSSVELLRIADDKAQALFDNCFELVSGPDAPDVQIQELNRELILTLTNENPLSNNYHEGYLAFDPGIPEEPISGLMLDTLGRSYTFQGYMVYQLADNTVSANELTDVERARLIYQCDIQDDVTNCINYATDPALGYPVPVLMVEAANEGVSHSFMIDQDAFATGDTRLINHKTYYFMAVAYGYNNYAEYEPSSALGQDEQFKASRKAATGAIRVYS
ncbi:MAG: T9SS C-terminal target domain-containing protein, partial [Flavobacteriales bacterium]|nr:T9SS C-terminal target domain-containing protein [Flavobacteriales bacterium]